MHELSQRYLYLITVTYVESLGWLNSVLQSAKQFEKAAYFIL